MAGTIVANTLNTDTGVFSTNNAYTGIAKAWVKFNGSAVTITNSFNCSSITRSSTGNYTINFSTSMPNANFCIAGSTNDNYGIVTTRLATQSTSSAGIGCWANGTQYDFTDIHVIICGN
jgi:hypothetical protein